jgi:hypothetical protein
MRDLKFTSDSGNLTVIYKTDLMNTTSRNFTVYSISGLDGQASILTNEREKAIYGEFKRLPYDLGAFIKFAEDYGLTLTSSDSDGSNPVELVAWDSIVDSSWADSILG